MLFAVLCNDKKDHLAMRMEVRDTHLEYLATLGEKLKLAGPFWDENGKSNGTLMIIEASDIAEAEKIAAADPYAKAGLFSSSTVRPWNMVINHWQK